MVQEAIFPHYGPQWSATAPGPLFQPHAPVEVAQRSEQLDTAVLCIADEETQLRTGRLSKGFRRLSVAHEALLFHRFFETLEDYGVHPLTQAAYH